MELKRGYKNTEVGVIPMEWDARQLGSLGTWKGGATPSMQNLAFWSGGNVPWLSSGDIKSTLISDAPMKITEAAVKQSSTTLLPRNSIMVVTRSGILRKFLPVSKNVVPIAINQDIKALIPESNVDCDYLLHTFIGNGQRILATCMKSGTTVESIEYPWLKKYQIPFPPLTEQRTIAATLSEVDALIASMDRLIAKKRDMKLATMQELLTGKRRLSGFSGDWQSRCLGDLGLFKNGINKGKEDFGYGSPFINLMDVFGIPTVSTGADLGLVNSSAIERNLYDLQRGDVLFVRSSVKPDGVGLTTLITEDLPDTVFSGFLIRYRVNEQLTFGFKKHCFFEAGFRSRLLANSTVSANANINQNALKALQISFPSDKDEQTAIAHILSDMDADIATIEQKLDKTRMLKQGMMQELLTGRIRLA